MEKKIPIGIVVDINPDSIGKSFPFEEIEYIDISSVGTGTITGTTRLSLSNAPSRAKRLVKHGDTILATVRPNLRSFYFIKNPSPNTVVSTGFAVLRARDSIDKRYLYYSVTSQAFTDYLSANVKGAAYPAVDTETISRGKIYFPSLATQQKIASILSAYDDLIENNLRRVKILEEMAQMIYREWFVNFRFPGYEKVKMVKSELGMIPEGWEIIPLSTLLKTQYGYTESAAEKKVGPKFLRGTDINKTSYIYWASVPYCPISPENYEKYKLSKGDIVVIRMADPGKVGIVEKDIDAVFASYLIRLHITSNKITPYYLFHFLLADRYQGYITGASTGTTRKSASAGVVTGIDMIVPQKELVNNFEAVASSLRGQIVVLLDKNANLRKTRDLLLPKLINGEIDLETIYA